MPRVGRGVDLLVPGSVMTCSPSPAGSSKSARYASSRSGVIGKAAFGVGPVRSAVQPSPEFGRLGLQVDQRPGAAGALDQLLVPVPVRPAPEGEVDHDVASLPYQREQPLFQGAFGVGRVRRERRRVVVHAVPAVAPPHLLVDGQPDVAVTFEALGVCRLPGPGDAAHQHTRDPVGGSCGSLTGTDRSSPGPVSRSNRHPLLPLTGTRRRSSACRCCCCRPARRCR